MAEKTKVVKQTKGRVISSKTFDTGIKAGGRLTIVIPGRGKVVIPNPQGDLYFDGNYTKDTGPTHVKQIKGTQAEWQEGIWDKCDGDPNDFGRFAITGVLKKKDYLYLARCGCVIRDGIIQVPAEHVEAVSKYLKIK